MLGEKLGEEIGKTTGMRVLPSSGDGSATMEVTFQAAGKFLGLDTTSTGTYVSVARPGGVLAGTGQGVLMTREGDMATWTGQGVGRFTGRGSAVSWRGAIYYHTASPKLARLNTVAGIFEYEVDENGDTVGKVWEWK